MSWQILTKGKVSEVAAGLKDQMRAVPDHEQFERVRDLILAELGELKNQDQMVQIDCQGLRSETGFNINLQVFTRI
jgi:hypothetical protein